MSVVALDDPAETVCVDVNISDGVVSVIDDRERVERMLSRNSDSEMVL